MLGDKLVCCCFDGKKHALGECPHVRVANGDIRCAFCKQWTRAHLCKRLMFPRAGVKFPQVAMFAPGLNVYICPACYDGQYRKSVGHEDRILAFGRRLKAGVRELCPEIDVDAYKFPGQASDQAPTVATDK